MVEGSSHAKNQLDSFIRFDRTPTCDGQTVDTDTGPVIVPHRDHRSMTVIVPRIASRGKNSGFTYFSSSSTFVFGGHFVCFPVDVNGKKLKNIYICTVLLLICSVY